MNQEYLVVPNSNDRIYNGSVVILQRLPNLRWVVHNGFYTYNGTTQNGWYLSSVPSQTNMPLFHNDLYGIRILSSDPCPCPPPLPPGPHPPFPPHPVPPFPPGPGPETIQYTKADKLMVDRSRITVPNLEERDKLMSSELIDGKVVRVNDYDGKVEYFEWDKENIKWNLHRLGERDPDADTIASKYATIETILNRIVDVRYPNTLEEVLSASGQFSTWKNRNIEQATPTDDTYMCINMVLNGQTNVLEMDSLKFNNRPIGRNPIKIGAQYYGK